MKVIEAKRQVLELIERDIEETGASIELNPEPPGSDVGKFVLAGEPARAIQPYNGFHLKINLDWFEGSEEPPRINQEPFYWYVFALAEAPPSPITHYFICSYHQLREFVLDFDAPLGDDHRDHSDWHGRIDHLGEEEGLFVWGDEEPSELDESRVIPLNNVQQIARGDDVNTDAWPSTWWVNQGSTYTAHRELGIVWAPQEGKDGTYEHHENVAKLSPGDRILHYKDKAIRAVGFVTGEPFETEQSPDDGRDRWNEEGYQASVEYHPLDEPVGRDEIPLAWRQEEGAPFTSGGELRQGYLYSLSEDFAKKVAGRFPQIGQHFPAVRGGTPGPEPAPVVQLTLDLEAVCIDFAEKVRNAGLTFGARHEDFIRDFVVSLATKQLVILTGLSGSGKTQIALQFGRWLGEDRAKVVPVRPDWTGAEALFGYPDALQDPEDGRRAWHVPEALAFMLRAARDSDRPYLMVLDEMNLAHVERYFADVISGMESGEACLPNLREEDSVWREAPEGPDKLPFPKNLFIAGTVNVDETTYMFSPKILDRANTIEFRVRAEELRSDLRRPDNCAPGDRALVQGFMSIAQNEDWHLQHTVDRREELVDHLRDLHRTLDHGFAFGHRVVYEALRFSALHHAAGGSGLLQALDIQIMQKILPRLHGARRRLEPVLCAVGKFCFDLTSTNADTFDPAEQNAAEAQLPRSFAKLQEMLERLRVNQFVSFTE